MKVKKHQTVCLAVGPSTAAKISAWRESYRRVRGMYLDDEQVILLALNALRHNDIFVAEDYRKTVLVEMHEKELAGEREDGLTSSDRYLNMDVCPERYYTVKETCNLLGVSRSLLCKLEDRGAICRASASRIKMVLFAGEDIIRARSKSIPRRGKYKKKE